MNGLINKLKNSNIINNISVESTEFNFSFDTIDLLKAMNKINNENTAKAIKEY